MAVEEVLADVAPEIILELGRIGNWVQAVGLIVVIWIVIQIITLYYNRKRRKMIEEILEKVEKVEKKVNKLGKKK